MPISKQQTATRDERRGIKNDYNQDLVLHFALNATNEPLWIVMRRCVCRKTLFGLNSKLKWFGWGVVITELFKIKFWFNGCVRCENKADARSEKRLFLLLLVIAGAFAFLRLRTGPAAAAGALRGCPVLVHLNVHGERITGLVNVPNTKSRFW